ncbi:MAG: aldehyde dehydrogenase family protein, partial [Acidimicrobiales bacterium]
MSNTLDQVPTGLFIGGEWLDGADKARIEVVDPATEQVLTDVAGAEVTDGHDAVDQAAAALPSWSATAPRLRAEILRAAYESMVQQADALAELITLENGKALRDAKGEVLYAAEFFRWNSEEAVRNLGTVGISPSGANRMMVVHQPVGVAVMITPWNFPAAMATRKIGPALAAGCTVVLKPATLTPLTALAIAKILQEAGVPDGVVNVVTTRHAGPVVSAMLADDPVRQLS